MRMALNRLRQFVGTPTVQIYKPIWIFFFFLKRRCARNESQPIYVFKFKLVSIVQP